jgi:hypothetical protein
MKYIKIILSIIFIFLIVGSLVYKGVIAPEDKTSLMAKLSEFTFPLFMLFSILLAYFKKKEDSKDIKKKSSLSAEDREKFSSIGNPDDY